MNDRTAVNVTLYVDGVDGCLKIFKGYRVESANRSFISTNGYTGSKEVRFKLSSLVALLYMWLYQPV